MAVTEESAHRSFPYLRLSAFYLFYFATLGAIIPYWSLYLRELGFQAVQIGTLMAALAATKVFAPHLLGLLSDFTGRRMVWIRLTTLLAASVFLAILKAHTFFELLLLMVGFGVFWSATLSQFEAVTITFLKEKPERYPWVRLWGSFGFIASVLGLGWFFGQHSITLLPQAIALQLWLVFLIALSVPEVHFGHRKRGEATDRRFLRLEVVLFLLLAFLVQLSHAPYYVFFSPYLEDHGYPKHWIGLLWTVGVVAEILFFLLFPLRRGGFTPTTLLLLGTGFGVIRWLVIGWKVADLHWLLPAQTLHAATFGAIHAGSMLLIRRLFPDRLQGRAQALYSSLSFGLGNMVGNEVAGQLWERLAPPWVYTLAAGVMLLAFLLAFLLWIVSRRKLR